MEELMASSSVRYLACLHERAQRHANEYKTLSGNRGARSKALEHLRKAEQLYYRVSCLIRDFSPDSA